MTKIPLSATAVPINGPVLKSQNANSDTNQTINDGSKVASAPVNGSEAGPQPVNGFTSEANPAASHKVVPPTSKVLTDFDLNAFRASVAPEAPTASPVNLVINAVRVEKPRKLQYIFVHPEWRDYLYIIPGDFGADRDAYLVVPAVAHAFPNICRRVCVAPYCARWKNSYNYYLWPIPQEDSAGRVNEWNKSAMREMHRAAGRWCQFIANGGNQTYESVEDPDSPEAPDWPPEGLNVLIKKAFEDHVIATSDHPLLVRLRGRQF
jgi:hypothetical protein